MMIILPGARIKAVCLGIVLLAGLALLGVEVLAAQEARPLLIPGKQTLFQRVITHPGARLFDAPGALARVIEKDIKPFTVFYIYQRKSIGEAEWLEVGLSSTGQMSGWIEASRASDWRQSMTLVFTERTGRRPVLFFKDYESLEEVAASPSPEQTLTELAAQFQAIKAEEVSSPEAFPVAAVAPAQEAVSRDRFYLIPIFQTAEPFEEVKFLKVASIDPGWAVLPMEGSLSTGIVFVIDTTVSMAPYIQRTREAMRKIYDAIESAGLADKVAFGLVAYRSSVERTPGLEYVTRVYSDLKGARRRGEFEAAMMKVDQAQASSHSFNEDAFAGLKVALEELNWAPYQARLIFLITDAGAIRNDDPYSTTGMNEAEIADMAAVMGVKIFALHLKTPAGSLSRHDNHAFAEAQYKALTGQTDPTLGHLYVPIQAESAQARVAGFGRAVEAVTSEMVKLVRATAAGERLELPGEGAAGDAAGEAGRKAAILGYAMQLDFLGQKGGIRAPRVVTSWVSDMDLTQPETPAFRVTVLLTKNQLSDLHARLKLILDNAQRTKRTGATDFFESIISAAAQTSRDPIEFSRRPNQNLGQLGLLGEFLDDLPYRSSFLRLTEEDWYRFSVGEQQAYVDDLKSKIRRYEEYYNDVDSWVTFGAENPGDAVYRVPLTMLP